METTVGLAVFIRVSAKQKSTFRETFAMSKYLQNTVVFYRYVVELGLSDTLWQNGVLTQNSITGVIIEFLHCNYKYIEAPLICMVPGT